mgnify:CR=1 FL=1
MAPKEVPFCACAFLRLLFSIIGGITNDVQKPHATTCNKQLTIERQPWPNGSPYNNFIIVVNGLLLLCLEHLGTWGTNADAGSSYGEEPPIAFVPQVRTSAESYLATSHIPQLALFSPYSPSRRRFASISSNTNIMIMASSDTPDITLSFKVPISLIGFELLRMKRMYLQRRLAPFWEQNISSNSKVMKRKLKLQPQSTSRSWTWCYPFLCTATLKSPKQNSMWFCKSVASWKMNHSRKNHFRTSYHYTILRPI